MKLSKKGIEKIIEACACDWDGIFDLKFTETELEATPFTQEDFKSHIILTVEEAKEIFNELSKLDIYTGLKTLKINSKDETLSVFTRSQKILEERIEQAEVEE